MPRKSPFRHKVKEHNRSGNSVTNYLRGQGQQSIQEQPYQPLKYSDQQEQDLQKTQSENDVQDKNHRVELARILARELIAAEFDEDPQTIIDSMGWNLQLNDYQKTYIESEIEFTKADIDDLTNILLEQKVLDAEQASENNMVQDYINNTYAAHLQKQLTSLGWVFDQGEWKRQKYE